jgi:membrane protein implicated in regulation of membrane protease activity
MYLVAIAWLYVTLMMALAEATHPHGTVLGAIVTFALYGAGPLSLVLYLLGTPLRRKKRQAEAAEEMAQVTRSAASDVPPA